MPHKGAAYDLAGGASAILEELASQQATGVFFIVGRMIEEHPDVVQAIAAAGHEIGLHGYEHDSLARYDAEALALFEKNLARVGSLVEDMTGQRPRAFRAPYLLWPNFYRHEVYEILRAQGFRWVSNRYVRSPVELLHPRPGKLPMPYAWRASDGSPRLARNRLLTGLLNAQLVLHETFSSSRAARLRWLLGKRDPFIRNGMVEVPVDVPLDCDLIGLPKPSEDTPQVTLDYARAVFRDAAAAPGTLSTITFHDWLVTGGNRLVLLRDTLTAAREEGAIVSTITQNPGWLPDLALSPRPDPLTRRYQRSVRRSSPKDPATLAVSAAPPARFRTSQMRPATLPVK
jgi:peptidoglycan/xylan/chitin deacetylase (PgdA/CDA1 family)